MGWRSDLEVLDLEVCREEESGQGAVPVFVAVVGQREQSGHLGHQDVAGCSKEQGTNQISFVASFLRYLPNLCTCIFVHVFCLPLP